MSKKKTFLSGDIDKYRETLDYSIVAKESFSTISTGLTRRIVLPTGVNLKFFGKQGKNGLVEGAFLVNMVQKEIDKYIEKNGVPEAHQPSQVQTFNTKRINQVVTGERMPIVGIDINSCYWYVAHKLGYISEQLFRRGLDTCKKKGLLIAIGCLNKLPMIKNYKDGELVSTTFDYEYNKKYSPFYWNIIYHTHEIMVQSFEAFKDDWFMFLTDCLFVDSKRIKDAQKFLNEKGFKTKFHTIEFKKFKENQITWWDFKDQKLKRMYAGHRDIRLYSDLYKASNKGEETPPSL